MGDLRFEVRIRRTDEVAVQWQDQQGQLRKVSGHLKDISLSGACLQIGQPIPWKTPLRITHVAQDVTGKVRYCTSRGATYFIGVRLDAGSEWRLHTTAQP